jgi:hypothetical protein
MNQPSRATKRPARRPSERLRPDVVSGATAVAALFAPVSLTGAGPVDAIERALATWFVAYVGCHGRRWAWLTAAAVVALPARGASLLFALVALAVVVAGSVPKRRHRDIGALGLGLMMNAVFWYPPSAQPWGVVAALFASILVVTSGIPHLRTTARRATTAALTAVAALVVGAGLASLLAMGLTYRHVQNGAASARSALDSARNGDADAATADLAQAASAFDAAATRIDGPFTAPALLVPGLAQQVDAVRATVNQGRLITAAADDLTTTADYDRLQYDGRLDLAQVRALAEPARRADATLGEARRELSRVQQGTLLPPLQDRVDQFASDIEEARVDTALAADLLEVTPGLFGADETRRYLIVFITPAELRGAGGFIGSYAELEITDGKAELTRSGRIDDLISGPNQGTRTITGQDEYLRRYGRFDPTSYLQDVTISPDFPTDAAVLAQLYPQAGGSEIDGVIALDPKGLAALLKLTGPVTVDGLAEPLSADNAVEVLTRAQYLDLPDRAARGEILTEATRVTFEKLIDSKLPAPRTLATTLSPATRAGHLRLWSPDPAEQALFERLGADGTLAIPRGSDGFSVVQQNSGNNKIDAYLQRTITYLPEVNVSSGALTAELRIELVNNVPSVDLPPAVVGNTRGVPEGTNLTGLTIFTPNVVTAATLDGKPLTLGPGREKGLNAWDTPLIQIPPGGKVTLVVQLKGGLDLQSGYRLTILPQPVANPDRFTSNLTVTDGSIAAAGGASKELLTDEPLEAPTTIRVPVKR